MLKEKKKKKENTHPVGNRFPTTAHPVLYSLYITGTEMTQLFDNAANGVFCGKMLRHEFLF